MTSPDTWQALTHDSVLSAVEQFTQCSLTSFCTARNSYINRVYEVETADKERLIAKFYRPGRWSKDMILGEHAFLAACAQNELPVIAPLSFSGATLFEFEGIQLAVFPKKGGRAIDELNEDLWKETGRLLGRVHQVATTCKNVDRIHWTPETATHKHLETLLACNVIPPDYQQVITQSIQRFIQQANPLFNDHPLQLIHGDCHFGNIIHRPGESLYLVDFDDCVIGPPIQDLWMLLPDTVENCPQEIAWFRDGYNTFGTFSEASLKLVPALQLMRQIHFASWCAIQSGEAHFHHHFPEWGSTRYWNELSKDVLGFC